ncbi:uncharacterized protein [Triticum aestivum]|uniref:uncharacterized protein isoform X2 n=1 Tax=Triticum aestivum TaxID=4565 RepID=UPI001D030B03|nr:uncharacterized protein LOC123044488 isoform X2 [Triticum aestivum]
MFRAQIRLAQARVPRPPPPPPDPELLLPCGSSPASLPPPNLHQPRLPPHPAGSPETSRRLPPLPSSTTPTTSTTRVVALLPRMATSVRSNHRRALHRQPPPTALDPVVPDHLPPSSTLSRRRDPPSLCSSALEARLMDHAAVTGWAVLLLPSSSHASMRNSHVAHFSVEERRKKNLISKVFSAEKMNHAKTQGGSWWLHCWRNDRGFECYQGDSKGVYRFGVDQGSHSLRARGGGACGGSRRQWLHCWSSSPAPVRSSMTYPIDSPSLHSASCAYVQRR